MGQNIFVSIICPHALLGANPIFGFKRVGLALRIQKRVKSGQVDLKKFSGGVGSKIGLSWVRLALRVKIQGKLVGSSAAK